MEMLLISILQIVLIFIGCVLILTEKDFFIGMKEKNKQRKKRKRLKKYNKNYTGNTYWERISTEEFGEIVNRPTVIIRSEDERMFVSGDRLYLQSCYVSKNAEGDYQISHITGFSCIVQIKRRIALERLCPGIGSYSAYTFDIIDKNF